MANSKFITNNLNPLLDTFLEDMDTGTMELEFGKVDDWSNPVASERELNAIFKSAKIISNKGNKKAKKSTFSYTPDKAFI